MNFVGLRAWEEREPCIEVSLTDGPTVDLHNWGRFLGFAWQSKGLLALHFLVIEEAVTYGLDRRGKLAELFGAAGELATIWVSGDGEIIRSEMEPAQALLSIERAGQGEGP